MNSRFEEFEALIEKLLKSPLGVFVAGRNDFDHRDRSPQPMLDDDAVRPVRIELLRRFANEPRRSWRGSQKTAVLLPGASLC